MGSSRVQQSAIVRLQRLEHYLAGHTMDPDACKRVFFAFDHHVAGQQNLTPHKSMNLSGDGAHSSSAPARRQYARPQGEFSEVVWSTENAGSIHQSRQSRQAGGFQGDHQLRHSGSLSGFKGDRQLLHGEVMVVFKETTNSVKPRCKVGAVLRGCVRPWGTLIAAPRGDVNVGEHDVIIFVASPCTGLTLDPTIRDPAGRV